MNNYCLPIIKKSKKEVEKILVANKKKYNNFEIWLDYIGNLDLDFIEDLSTIYKGRLVFLFRRLNLEKIKMKIQKRQEILTLLNNSKSFVDLDLETQKEELDFIKKNGLLINTILSYHNYKKTPAENELNHIVGLMIDRDPDIFKIATKCNNEEDSLRLLKFLIKFKKARLKYVVLGMGNFGLVTRVFGMLWGNEFNFAPISSKSKSAEGQLTREQYEQIFKILKLR
jgi:3-dehydroquinate dehydratase I